MGINKKRISILQIILLVVGIIAISSAIGSELKIVSAGTQCEDDGGICTTSCEELEFGPYEQSLLSCGLGSGKVCCKPASSDGENNEIPTGLGDNAASIDPKDYKSTYKAGTYSYTYTKNGKLQEGEVNIDQETAAGGENKIIEYIGKQLGSVPKDIVLGKLKNLLEGSEKEGAKEITKWSAKFWGEAAKGSGGHMTAGQLVSNALGALIGAAAAWVIYKWALNGDVRNMRDVTVVAGIGATVAWTIGAIAGMSTGPVGLLAFALVMIGSLFVFQNYSQEIFTYSVGAWKAKTEGEDCNKCNDLRYGCNEYQCKSFGKGCELINDENDNEEVCIWKDPEDILPPVINASDKVLPSEDYSWEPIEVTTGVKLTYNKDQKGCIPAYSSVTLGVETDEFADCKIDTERPKSFEEMIAPMQKVVGYAKEHILFFPHIATPSVEAQENAGISETQITNGKSQEFFIKCEDANGNSNPESFIMEFCVQDGPDTTAPEILGTNFLGYLQYDQTSVDLEVYTNEPAECKWDFNDKEYESMENEMEECSMSEGQYMFSGYEYGCKDILTGIKNDAENHFYIRCKDKPWWSEGDSGQRFANENSFELNLIGTKPLLIDKITVNGLKNDSLIKDSTNTIHAKIEVKTSAGAQQGKAICRYKSGNSYVDFYNEGISDFVNVNTQDLYLPEGDYTIPITCKDAGGNTAEDSISFTIEMDKTPPKVVRAYNDINNLRIITDETAECVYTTKTNVACDYLFEDGEKMSAIGDVNHYSPWKDDSKYFIKCKDEFGNLPLPGKCSIIINTFSN